MPRLRHPLLPAIRSAVRGWLARLTARGWLPTAIGLTVLSTLACASLPALDAGPTPAPAPSDAPS
ncbi:MAG: hypothetical protein ABMB14_34025, partial [Myxococcota bacterium]